MKKVLLDTNVIDAIKESFPNLKDKAQKLGFNLVTTDILWSQIRNIPEEKKQKELMQVVHTFQTTHTVGYIPELSNPRWSSPISEERTQDFLGNKEDNTENRADAFMGLTALDADGILITSDHGLTKEFSTRGGTVFTPEAFNAFLENMEQQPKIVTISIPEYTIDSQPNYTEVGAKIDKIIADNFEGQFLVRELSIADHPQYTLNELADIIIETGTDKYDPNRKGVAHEEFEPYRPDLQAGKVVVKDGKLISESFAEDIRRFYENTLLDRGYRLRIDLLVLYDPNQMIQAEKLDESKPSTESHLEQYLWRFKDQEQKPKALVGIIKILR